MFKVVIAIHVLTCFLLILIVLIQQGRGGGLIDTLSSAESVFGTKTSSFLVKATTVLSIIFFFSCLSLAFLAIQKNKSLVDTSYRPPVEKAVSEKPKAEPAPAAEAKAKEAKAQETKPKEAKTVPADTKLPTP